MINVGSVDRMLRGNMYSYLALGACMIAWPAWGGDLGAMQGGSVDLGSYHGIVYFTDDGSSSRVVVTMATSEGTPIRFIATLSENEHLYISVPGKVGEPERTIDLERVGGKLTPATAQAGTVIR